jgi:hypothetical protein
MLLQMGGQFIKSFFNEGFEGEVAGFSTKALEVRAAETVAGKAAVDIGAAHQSVGARGAIMIGANSCEGRCTIFAVRRAEMNFVAFNLLSAGQVGGFHTGQDLVGQERGLDVEKTQTFHAT